MTDLTKRVLLVVGFTGGVFLCFILLAGANVT